MHGDLYFGQQGLFVVDVVVSNTEVEVDVFVAVLIIGVVFFIFDVIDVFIRYFSR